MKSLLSLFLISALGAGCTQKEADTPPYNPGPSIKVISYANAYHPNQNKITLFYNLDGNLSTVEEVIIGDGGELGISWGKSAENAFHLVRDSTVTPRWGRSKIERGEIPTPRVMTEEEKDFYDVIWNALK